MGTDRVVWANNKEERKDSGASDGRKAKGRTALDQTEPFPGGLGRSGHWSTRAFCLCYCPSEWARQGRASGSGWSGLEQDWQANYCTLNRDLPHPTPSP